MYENGIGGRRMNCSRIIGNNILLELQSQSKGLMDLAAQIGYSEQDIHKLTEGRLFVPPVQLDKIADALGIGREDLTKSRGREAYSSMIHNFRSFKCMENQDLVLDLIDMYADLEEALD